METEKKLIHADMCGTALALSLSLSRAFCLPARGFVFFFFFLQRKRLGFLRSMERACVTNEMGRKLMLCMVRSIFVAIDSDDYVRLRLL